MHSKSKFNGSVTIAAKHPIHITSRDKRLLENMVAEADALRSAPRAELKALAEELQRAVVVDPRDVPGDVITMNSRAEMLDLGTGETVTFTLVFPSQANIDEERFQCSRRSAQACSVIALAMSLSGKCQMACGG
jgi:regulator of nucleoside diphosphate kinase